MRPFLPVTLLALVLAGCPAPESSSPASPSAPPPAYEKTAVEPSPPSADAAQLLPNGLQLEADLLTGGQPTEEQLEQIAAAGYRTILNLRTAGEPGQLGRKQIEAQGLHLVTLPIAGKEGMTEENARRFAELLADPSLRPLVVHCGSGNRIGGLFALKAFHLDGLAPEDALEIGRSSGMTRLEPTLRELLGLSPLPAG